LGFDDAPSGPAVGAKDADEISDLMRVTSIQEQESQVTSIQEQESQCCQLSSRPRRATYGRAAFGTGANIQLQTIAGALALYDNIFLQN
jgi:hypothetical protein